MEETTTTPTDQPKPNSSEPTLNTSTNQQKKSIASMFDIPDFKVSAIQTAVKESFGTHKGNIKGTVEDLITTFPDDKKTICYAMLLLGKLYGGQETEKEINENLPRLLKTVLTEGAKIGHQLTMRELHNADPRAVDEIVEKVIAAHTGGARNPNVDSDPTGKKEMDF